MTVATPLAFVVEVGEAKLPPVAVDDHVTVRPETSAALPFTSASCAAIVNAPPTDRLVADDVTTYFVAGPATVTTAAELPVSDELSVAMIAYEPVAVAVVNEIEAAPVASVVDVADANDPPVPVFDQVTTRPAPGTELSFTSASC